VILERDRVSTLEAIQRSGTDLPETVLTPDHSSFAGPAGLRVTFALIVAVPGTRAVLINADNSRGGWLPLRVALRRDGAFAVEVGYDVLAVDQDGTALAPVVDELGRELRGAGSVPVFVASGREGHRHLFARVRDRERWTARARDLGLPGDAIRLGNNLIRPPLSPHRLGLPVALLDPTDPVEAVVALAPRERTARRLSRRMRKLLREGQ